MVHHSELLAKLVAEGKLKPRQRAEQQVVQLVRVAAQVKEILHATLFSIVHQLPVCVADHHHRAQFAVYRLTATAAIVGDVDQAQAIARTGAQAVLTSSGVQKRRVEVHVDDRYIGPCAWFHHSGPAHDERFADASLVVAPLVTAQRFLW